MVRLSQTLTCRRASIYFPDPEAKPIACPPGTASSNTAVSASLVGSRSWSPRIDIYLSLGSTIF
jgi:hypothetical protein